MPGSFSVRLLGPAAGLRERHGLDLDAQAVGEARVRSKP